MDNAVIGDLLKDPFLVIRPTIVVHGNVSGGLCGPAGHIQSAQPVPFAHDTVGAVRMLRDLPLLVRITPKAPDVGAVFKLYFLEYLFYLHYNTLCKKLQVVKSTNIVIRIFTYTTHPGVFFRGVCVEFIA